MIIETSRLILRRPRLADAPALFEFLGNSEAMKYTHADASLRDCRRRIAIHEWRRRHDGYAPWTILTKTTEQPIGWGGLYDDPFQPGWGVEIGYFFHPSTWGQGYASEMLTACLNLADHTLRLSQLHAFAHPMNTASQHVLQKAGFETVRFIPQMHRLLYRRHQSTNPPTPADHRHYPPM